MEKKIISQKILALDTSGFALSAALLEGQELRASVQFHVGLRHSELLLPTCKFILESAACEKKDLTAIAVTTGPGSFTGLRVGVAFARALAQSLELPLVGVSTFDAIARGLPPQKNRFAILLESIGQEVFYAPYSGDGKPAAEAQAAALPELILRLKKYSKITLLGAGAVRHAPALQKALGRRLNLIAENYLPQAEYVARIAAEKLLKAQTNDWRAVVPVYLRPPIAIERAQYRKKG